jgi:hypothetical protein
MAQSYFPFDSGAGANVTEAQWSKMAQNWLSTGVIKSYNNELSVYADSTGMQAKIKTGAAWIKGHYFEADAEEVLAIGTADGTNPRIDRIIVRLDWSLNTVQLAVLQGTPAVSPTAPALTQNTSRWEISLSQVYVGANVSTISAGNVTDERYFVSDKVKGIAGEMIQHGFGSIGAPTSGNWFGTVTFPKAFSSTPHVTAVVNSNQPQGYGIFSINNVTTTGFDYYQNVASGYGVPTVNFYWIAIGQQ